MGHGTCHTPHISHSRQCRRARCTIALARHPSHVGAGPRTQRAWRRRRGPRQATRTEALAKQQTSRERAARRAAAPARAAADQETSTDVRIFKMNSGARTRQRGTNGAQTPGYKDIYRLRFTQKHTTPAPRRTSSDSFTGCASQPCYEVEVRALLHSSR